MNYSAIKYYDIANGPGIRTSLFVSGCRHHCKNCFNEITWDFNYGTPFTAETIVNIINAVANPHCDGFSLLGGEPFEPENIPECTKIVQILKQNLSQKNIWAYSGFTFEQLIKRPDAYEMLKNIDVLVDGKFIKEQKNLMLKFRGSENQRIINVPLSLKTNSVITIDDNEI